MRESKNFCANYLTKVTTVLNGIWYTDETCWYDELHTFFNIVQSVVKGENPTSMILLKKKTKKKTAHFNAGLYSDIYRPVDFRLGMLIETT